ncbi:alpha/beta hydrolase family protein [Nocardia fluminea]|uniref:Alpha/beta hydrolase family protein n=1 Tax=Nocardia fluminea TaxID=134984 RepID=A0A2N3VGX0_9NOCA|nr:alpha/beta fold hydrolase [Nocardia fluminea]PKV80877.1 alpha/beta hydrolase family protein [Nocardia fluminea]
MIDVLILPGTGFPRGDGISLAFADALDLSKFRPRIVEYAAAYGGLDMPYAESRYTGRRALLQAITGYRPFVLGGYSQGAGIAGNLAVEIAQHMPGVMSDHLVGCALIADPSRPIGAGMPHRPPAPGYGIAGQRAVSGVPTWWAAADGDPITALPAGNPLRSIADLTEWYSLAGPDEIARWGADLVEKCRSGLHQRWWSLDNWRKWTGALAYARGYLIDGRHTTDYLRLGHVQALADVLNREEF